jgi:hypothetical protein
MNIKNGVLLMALMLAAGPSLGLERPDVTFKIFQFPADQIPRIDGDPADWDLVPERYAIGIDQLKDTVKNSPIDTTDLNVTVRVGWVKGLNRLYFLYQAYDDYWDFSHRDLHNDIFEIVVDGDLSGGPLIPQMRPDKETNRLEGTDGHFQFHGVQAQNYHILTPAEDKSWTMVWGANQWIDQLPWANAASNYNFKPGDSGHYTLECWITPFDYAPYEGPARAVESKLTEDALIGLSWSILDYDDVTVKQGGYDGFWNLSQKTTMYGDASDLVAFRLMPIEADLRAPIQALWEFTVLDMDRRLIAFKDTSYGEVAAWTWDFGDGHTATEQHPIHQYQEPGTSYTVTLYIEGPKGKSRLSKVWDVMIR